MTREQRLEQALRCIAEYWNGKDNISAMHDACKVTRDTAWQALAEPKVPDAAPDSVRVRIAVAVSEDGWVGCSPCGEAYEHSEAMKAAVSDTAESDLVAQAFIEADLPRIPTVQAHAVEAKS